MQSGSRLKEVKSSTDLREWSRKNKRKHLYLNKLLRLSLCLKLPQWRSQSQLKHMIKLKVI
jgi:hypothetical protein